MMQLFLFTLIVFILLPGHDLKCQTEDIPSQDSIVKIGFSRIKISSPKLYYNYQEEEQEDKFYTEYQSRLVEEFEKYLDSIIALQDRYSRFMNSRSEHLLDINRFERNLMNFNYDMMMHSAKVSEHNARHAGKASVPILDYYECVENNRLRDERNSLIMKEDSLVRDGFRLLSVRYFLDSLVEKIVEENKQIDIKITGRVFEDIQEEGGNALAGLNPNSKDNSSYSSFNSFEFTELKEINSEYLRIFNTKNRLRDSILNRKEEIDKYESIRQDLMNRIEENNKDHQALQLEYESFNTRKYLSSERYNIDRLILLAKITKLKNRAWITYEKCREFASICSHMESEEEEFKKQYRELVDRTKILDTKKEELLLRIK